MIHSQILEAALAQRLEVLAPTELQWCIGADRLARLESVVADGHRHRLAIQVDLHSGGFTGTIVGETGVDPLATGNAGCFDTDCTLRPVADDVDDELVALNEEIPAAMGIAFRSTHAGKKRTVAGDRVGRSESEHGPCPGREGLIGLEVAFGRQRQAGVHVEARRRPQPAILAPIQRVGVGRVARGAGLRRGVADDLACSFVEFQAHLQRIRSHRKRFVATREPGFETIRCRTTTGLVVFPGGRAFRHRRLEGRALLGFRQVQHRPRVVDVLVPGLAVDVVEEGGQRIEVLL